MWRASCCAAIAIDNVRRAETRGVKHSMDDDEPGERPAGNRRCAVRGERASFGFGRRVARCSMLLRGIAAHTRTTAHGSGRRDMDAAGRPRTHARRLVQGRVARIGDRPADGLGYVAKRCTNPAVDALSQRPSARSPLHDKRRRYFLAELQQATASGHAAARATAAGRPPSVQ